MAKYGQTLLRQLTFQYCDRMGCAVGIREYIERLLPEFARAHPHVEVVTVLKRNRFPFVKAEYVLPPASAKVLERRLISQQQQQQQQDLGQQQQQQQEQPDGSVPQPQPDKPPAFNSNVIGVKSRSAADIHEVVWWLSQSQCRPTTKRIPAKHIKSKNSSIQGAWTPITF